MACVVSFLSVSPCSEDTGRDPDRSVTRAHSLSFEVSMMFQCLCSRTLPVVFKSVIDSVIWDI